MTRRVVLDGASDDLHGVRVDGQGDDGYRPYKVTITIDEHVVTATMAYRHPEWVCEIEVPDAAVIMVNEDDGFPVDLDANADDEDDEALAAALAADLERKRELSLKDELSDADVAELGAINARLDEDGGD